MINTLCVVKQHIVAINQPYSAIRIIAVNNAVVLGVYLYLLLTEIITNNKNRSNQRARTVGTGVLAHLYGQLARYFP